MSMKRNILKKTLSEDLTWTDFLKNKDQYTGRMNPLYSQSHYRSLHSTPEKKHEIPCESGNE